MSMISKLLYLVFGSYAVAVGIVLLVFLSCLIIRDIINDLKRWYKGDDWGWIESLEEYGYQKRYG